MRTSTPATMSESNAGRGSVLPPREAGTRRDVAAAPDALAPYAAAVGRTGTAGTRLRGWWPFACTGGEAAGARGVPAGDEERAAPDVAGVALEAALMLEANPAASAEAGASVAADAAARASTAMMCAGSCSSGGAAVAPARAPAAAAADDPAGREGKLTGPPVPDSTRQRSSHSVTSPPQPRT
jgi:hypothetical protein